MIYFFSRVFYSIILYWFFDFKVTGRENIPKKGPFIVVSNHISYADPVVIGVSFNTVPIISIAKSELFDKSLLGRWIKSLGCISIPRHSGSPKPLKQALERLRDGKVLGIFPEGTRSKDGKLKKAELGVGLLVVKSKVPVIPMYIWGTDKALPIGQNHLTKAKVSARIGKPIDISLDEKFLDKKKYYAYIGEQIMKAIAEIRDARA